MNRKLLIDYDEVRNLFNKKFKETMQLIQDGEAHLDNLAEGFTEADRVLFKLLFLSPKTNADCIRAMSDEELAEWILWTNTVCDCCAKVQECDEVPGYKMCKDGVFDWLKQPVKEDNDG